MELIHLAQNGEKLRAVVNTVMNFCFHKMQEISGVAEELLASQEGLRYMGLLLLLGIVSGYARYCQVSRLQALNRVSAGGLYQGI